ncbi:PE family protein [Mycobacterium ulcerans str. Harvey]|uniref:PE family protein n=1 Tax=Mycobacterium ulcerans str. Harvey TaxID=1299332 RepID=A0ABN0QQS0_MYCUL|nr:PE family protein [Mycobacterium ulcerans str. Harvey]
MSYFIAVPDELALAATELDSIGAALSVANVAAALRRRDTGRRRR